MYNGKKIIVVMPAYNAAKTVIQTVDEVHQQGIVDEIILVDDRSRDDTVQVASQLLGVRVHVHEKNTGYGGNQKTCYRLALACRRGHRHHGASGLSIHAHADSGDGLDDRQRPAPVRAGQPHSRRLFAARGHARLEIYCEPLPHRGGKPFARRETFGIPHRLPRVLKGSS